MLLSIVCLLDKKVCFYGSHCTWKKFLIELTVTCSTIGCALEDNNILPGHFRDVLGDGSVGFFLEKMIVLLYKRH